MKTLLSITFALVLSTFSLLADESIWAEKTYQWTGNGTMNTEVFPIFGDQFSVAYLSPKAGLTVIFVPLNRESKQTLKNESVLRSKYPIAKLSRKNLDTPVCDEARKNDPALCWGYLFISGKGPWRVDIDQYVDSFQGWRLQQFLKNRKEDALTTSLGIWADQGTQKISFTPTVSPWKITAVPETDGNLTIKVRRQDKKLYFDSAASKAGENKSGWIYSLEPVEIEVTCATTDQAWTVEASAQ